MNSWSIDNSLYGAATNQVLGWKYEQQITLLEYDSEWNAQIP